MKEARIECLAKEFPVHDLKLDMRRGDVVWKPEAQAKKSRELAEAVRIGAVAVRYVERCQVAKPPPPPKRHVPPSVRMSRPNKGGMVRKPPESSPGEPQMDKKMVKEAVREEIREALAGGQQAPTVSKDMLKDALREVLGEMGAVPAAAPAAGAPTAKGDEPVYIPSNIVDKDAKADITAKKGESEGDDLEAAAAALKASKPKTTRKRRTRKKPTEE